MRNTAIILLLNFLSANAQIDISFNKYKVFDTNLQNNSYNEIQNCFYDDGLIISANYKPDNFKMKRSKFGEYLYDLYYLKNNTYTEFAEPILMFNSNKKDKLFNWSAIVIRDDNSCVFNAAACAEFGYNSGKNSLYQGIINENKIDSISRINFCDDDYNFIHATLSKNGEIIIFTCDVDSNYNIYYSKKTNSTIWSTPIPISEINTEKNEIMPFLVNDSILVFASDGLEGYGKFDLFYSVKSELGWSTPINCGENINSKYNETGLILHPNFQFGYFSSDRKGKLNIYMMKLNGG